MTQESKFLRHAPCPHCGSSDANAIYSDHTLCFACDKWTPGGDNPGHTVGQMEPRKSKLEMTGAVRAIKDRRISAETCAKFGVTVETGADGSITTHYYPRYSTVTKDICATKKRICATKEFKWSGDRTDMGMFGQNTCKGSGKYLTITEGEIDAMAVSEMFDRKWDVVSIDDGAQSAARCISKHLEFIEGYDAVVFCFDNDKDGQKAVDACKDIISPNKLKVCTLPMKDAGAMLAQGKVKDFVAAWWAAKSYQPQGIVKISETKAAVYEYRDTPSIPYPWDGLTEMLMGQRRQEIVIWAADTGIGKSQTMREIQDHIIQSTDDEVVGALMLEESIAKTTLGWMSFRAGRPLHKELDTLSDEELDKWWTLATKEDRIVLLDHKGWQNNIETLKARIRYMKHAMGCNYIILDHLHIALSSVQGATGDWAGIDELVTDFVSLVQELDIGLHLVCHTTGERSLRGSKGISKLADAVIFLERDKHNEDPEIANTTAVVVDKNRWCGDIGTACWLKYDPATHRMTETTKPIEGDIEGEF